MCYVLGRINISLFKVPHEIRVICQIVDELRTFLQDIARYEAFEPFTSGLGPDVKGSKQTWGQFNSIGIAHQFQFQFRNWNCLFEKIIELELKSLELELKFATKNLNPQIIIYTI